MLYGMMMGVFHKFLIHQHKYKMLNHYIYFLMLLKYLIHLMMTYTL